MSPPPGPGRRRIYVTPYGKSADTLRARRLLVKEDLTFAELLLVLRRSMDLQAGDALFLLVRRTLVSPQAVVRDVHAEHADADGVLRLNMSRENCFG